MPDLLLCTLNAKYIHTAFGLRYLLANLGDLRDRAALLEFDLNQRPLDLAEQLLAREPRVIGFGVYIWNVTPTTELVALLKRLRPGLTIVLGGPEVSYAHDLPALAGQVDYVITGEADLAFADLCRQILAGTPPASKFIAAGYAKLSDVALPYDLYADGDLAHRIVYVEASRGCAFGCEFCLSSLDVPVRQFELDGFLDALDRLWRRGARQFKFVDRTFNLNPRVSRRILEFFLARAADGLFLHFEMVPDRLPAELRSLLAGFPAGTVQLEIGIQSFNEDVTRRIHRPQHNATIIDNLRFLRRETGVHLHTDLIVGLPGESLESVADGFDRLIGLGVHEIQVGLLKRLRGAPITRHDAEWRMVYSPLPPYELVESATLDFATMQRVRRFARSWDLIGNSGNFVETTPRLWADGRSPFAAVLAFSDWLLARLGRQHAIALVRLAGCLHEYLTGPLGHDPAGIAASLRADFRRCGRGDDLPFLAPEAGEGRRKARSSSPGPGNRRQTRHRGNAGS